MLYLEYKKRELSAELHIWAKGGHGFACATKTTSWSMTGRNAAPNG